MPNILGTLSGTLVIQRALELTFQKYPVLRLFAMGFKDLDGRVESMVLGQTAVSRLRTIPTVGNFGDAAQTTDDTDVPVVLSNFRQVMYSFLPEEYNATTRNLIDEAAEPLARAIAAAIVGNVFAQACQGNFSDTTNLNSQSQVPYIAGAAASATRANTIVAGSTALDLRGVDKNNRFILLNSPAYGALQLDAVIVAALNNPDNNSAILKGRLPRVSDMELDNYPGMPNTDGNLWGIAGVPGALGYVARAPRDPRELIPNMMFPGNIGNVIDENSGFQIQVTQWIDPLTLKLNNRFAWFDGLAALDPAKLMRFVTGVASGSANTVTAINVINPGYGYKNSSGVPTAPLVTLVGGGGTGATATATISANGAVTGFAITNAGSGYTSNPTPVIAPVSSGTVAGPATAVATVGGLY